MQSGDTEFFPEPALKPPQLSVPWEPCGVTLPLRGGTGAVFNPPAASFVCFAAVSFSGAFAWLQKSPFKGRIELDFPVAEGLEKSSSTELSEAAGMILTPGLSRPSSATRLPLSLDVPFNPEETPWVASDPDLADRQAIMVAWLTTGFR